MFGAPIGRNQGGVVGRRQGVWGANIAELKASEAVSVEIWRVATPPTPRAIPIGTAAGRGSINADGYQIAANSANLILGYVGQPVLERLGSY